MQIVYRNFELFFVGLCLKQNVVQRLEETAFKYSQTVKEEISEVDIKRALMTFHLSDCSKVTYGFQKQEEQTITVYGLRNWFERWDGLNYVKENHKAPAPRADRTEIILKIAQHDDSGIRKYGMCLCGNCGKLLSQDTPHCTYCLTLQVHVSSVNRLSKVQ